MELGLLLVKSKLGGFHDAKIDVADQEIRATDSGRRLDAVTFHPGDTNGR
jgi:hypothetical protein